MASTISSPESLPKPDIGNPVHLLAFGFGAGCSPFAPGTMGTLLAVGVYLPLSLLPLPVYGLMLAVIVVLGIWLCGRAARDASAVSCCPGPWKKIAERTMGLAATVASWPAQKCSSRAA